MTMTATLERYMTRHPHTIRIDEKLDTAQKLMSSLGVRHLPVLEAGKLVGVVSDRDMKGAGKSADARKSVLVSDVFIEEPFSVDIDTSLFVVAQTMAEKKLGSAIVLEEGKVAGIFTAVDACRALADVLGPESRF
jgi:acetoin utilization protein AcuB